MEAPSPGRPLSHSHTVKPQSCWWWLHLVFPLSTARTLQVMPSDNFQTKRPNSAFLTSLQPGGDPLGLSLEEEQSSNPFEASFCANSHRIRSDRRQDVSHCRSPSFSWLLGGKSVCLYFLLFPWLWLLTWDGFWRLSVRCQLLLSWRAEHQLLLAPAHTGLSEKDLQSGFL